MMLMHAHAPQKNVMLNSGRSRDKPYSAHSGAGVVRRAVCNARQQRSDEMSEHQAITNTARDKKTEARASATPESSPNPRLPETAAKATGVAIVAARFLWLDVC